MTVILNAIWNKNPPTANKSVKFCLIKQDLSELTKADTSHIAHQVSSLRHLRSDKLDIESFKVKELLDHSMNLMWFCGVSNLTHRDIFLDFLGAFDKVVEKFSTEYVSEGYRSEGGNAKLLFMTRKLSEARIEEAFLDFENDAGNEIECHTKLGTIYRIERSDLTPALRTSVGVRKLDITEQWDYIAHTPYKELPRVKRASGIPGRFKPVFWDLHQRAIENVKSHLVMVRRINPYSPNTNLMAFFSEQPVCPGDQLKAMPKFNLNQSQAMTVLINSILFIAQFILLKEESTGRFIDIRSYDIGEMKIYPDESLIPKLIEVFNKYSQLEFPSLREQMDTHFDQRYKDFWTIQRRGQSSLFSVLNNPVEPSDIRLNFDLDICQALGVKVTKEELIAVYGAIVKEMVLTRGLTRD